MMQETAIGHARHATRIVSGLRDTDAVLSRKAPPSAAEAA